MFDKKSFEDGCELGQRLGRSSALFDTWLHDLPALKEELIEIIYGLSTEELTRSDVCNAVLDAVRRLSDKVNKEHAELAYGDRNDRV